MSLLSRAKRIFYLEYHFSPKTIVELLKCVNPLALANPDKISDDQIRRAAISIRLFSGLGVAIKNYIEMEKRI